jgi:Protein of unknown function (DUF3108)
MHYSTTNSYPPRAINLASNKYELFGLRTIHQHPLLILLATLCILSAGYVQAGAKPVTEPPAVEHSIADVKGAIVERPVAELASKPKLTLQAYTATYSSTVRGIDATMQQSLKKTDTDQWQLHNEIALMFVGFEEQAQFRVTGKKLTPVNYDYSNSFSSKRESSLRFDWENNSVTDIRHSKTPLTIPEGALDKLGFQVQLRLDLLNSENGNTFTEKTYTLVERKKLKHYIVTPLGEELINTSAGKFNAIKLQQRRQGKDKHTLIWLAKDWDYFVLRIQRIEEGKSRFQVDLSQATINGKVVQGL